MDSPGLEALHSWGEPVSPGTWLFTVKEGMTTGPSCSALFQPQGAEGPPGRWRGWGRVGGWPSLALVATCFLSHGYTVLLRWSAPSPWRRLLVTLPRTSLAFAAAFDRADHFLF